MYQNKLHELVDAQKNNKIKAIDYEINKSDIDRTLKLLPSMAKYSMCFVADSDDVPFIKINSDLFKLPYKKCWFEFRRKEITAGLLCFEFESKIHVCLFSNWSFGWAFCGLYKINDASDERGDIICEVGSADVAKNTGKIFRLFATYLTALNCCNIKRTEHKPEPSKQSVRRALGRQPLFSTWTLEIDLQRTASEMPGQGGTHASPRLHLRRGHARQHKPGLWCWVQPHVVGDKSAGMIHKDYASH